MTKKKVKKDKHAKVIEVLNTEAVKALMPLIGIPLGYLLTVPIANIIEYLGAHAGKDPKLKGLSGFTGRYEIFYVGVGSAIAAAGVLAPVAKALVAAKSPIPLGYP